MHRCVVNEIQYTLKIHSSYTCFHERFQTCSLQMFQIIIFLFYHVKFITLYLSESIYLGKQFLSNSESVSTINLQLFQMLIEIEMIELFIPHQHTQAKFQQNVECPVYLKNDGR